MAEQFKKIYITVRDFVVSWEKEVYELNNLDYFIYILINQMGFYIRKEYFTDDSYKNELYLTDDEISVLAFNICDTLYNFMEKNCYAACPFHCPSHMKDKINPNEKYLREIFMTEDTFTNPSCRTKEDCFYMEVLNNVVLESLVDFYNYDKGMVLDVSDLDFYKLASIIVDQIVGLVTGKGADLLKNPFENKSYLFEELLAKAEDDGWDIRYLDADEEDDDETELWKIEHLLIENVIDEYKKDNPVERGKGFCVLDKFKTFLVDFLGLQKITDLDNGDIKEFMAIHFIHEMVLEKKKNVKDYIDTLRSFYDYIDYYFKLNLSSGFKSFMRRESAAIERVIALSVGYFDKKSFVDFMLSDEYSDETIDEGFFELASENDSVYTFLDIHLNQFYELKVLESIDKSLLRVGDILHMQLSGGENNRRFVSLEMVYPPFAKIYLL